MDKVEFRLTWEDKEVLALRKPPFSEDEYHELTFRDGSWTPHGSAGESFRASPINEEEAMRRTSGVKPDFSRKSFQS